MNRDNLTGLSSLLLFALVAVVFAPETQGAPSDQAGGGTLLFYASFDKGVDADLARGDARGLFNGLANGMKWDRTKDSHGDPLLKRAPGIRGMGLVTGVDGQVVYYQAPKNIDPSAWTVTFWAKALAGKDYMRGDPGHMQMFEIQGRGWTRFYKYDNRAHLWLLVSRPGPNHQKLTQTLVLDKTFDTGKWHFFAVSFQRQSGASIYLDGNLAARDASIQPAMDPQWFRVGQSFGGAAAPNRIIDEFKIYGGALSDSDVVRKYLLEDALRTGQTMRVGPTQRSITIDGRLDAAEWADASATAILIDRAHATAAQTPTRVLMTYDDTHLYLGFHSDIPQEAKQMPETRLLHGILKSSALNHDTNVDFDDSFGVHVIPRYPKGSLYRLYVNGIETTSEHSISPGGGPVAGWDPKWEVKSRISMEGWTVESRIPLSAFGVDRIQPGEQWQFQFFRNWRRLKKATDVWEYQSGPHRERGDGMGTVVFTGRANVAVQAELDGFAQGQMTAQADLRNTGPADISVKAVLKAGDEVLSRHAYTLGAGRTQRFTAQADLRQVAAHQVRLEVASTGDKPFYALTVPFYLPQPLALALRSYPSQKLITVSWQLQGVKQLAKDLSGVVEIVDAGNGSTVLIRRISPLPSLYGSARIQVDAVPPGSYKVRMAVKQGDRLLVSRTANYRKRALPAWFGNTLGLSDRVPKPWTPLVVAGNSVSMWGRTYEFSDRLLPVQLLSQGRRTLARPMTLRVKTAAGSVSSASDVCQERWLERTPTRVQCRRTQRLADLDVTLLATIEFDGFFWMELRVAPTGAKATVEELTLSIPMRKAYAHLINAYDYSLRTTGELPADGYRSAMGPRWIGDEEGGIQVFAEHSANWVVRDKRRELTVTCDADAVLVQLHLVDKPFELTEPRTFALGLTVTPVKPTVSDMRDILSMSSRFFSAIKGTANTAGEYPKRAFQSHKGLRVYHIWSQGWWKTVGMPGAGNRPDRTAFYPLPREDLPSDWGVWKTEYGATIYQAPYARLQQTWAGSPEFDQFKDEWLSNINKLYVQNGSIPVPWRAVQVCQGSRSYADFYLWGLNQLLERTQTRAFYFDVSKPHPCNNIYHGCGVVAEDGQPAPTSNMLGTRRLLRRIYTLLREKHPDGLIFFHMSGQVNMAIWSFTDALVDGENYTSLLDRKENRGYEKVLRLDQFAAEYAAQNNFGPYSVVLPEFSRSGAIRGDEWAKLGYQHVEYLLGLIFLHNSQLWYPANVPLKLTNKIYDAFDSNGLTSKWTYIGYWKQKGASLPADVKASFYVSPDRRKAFMLVMNVREKDLSLDIPLHARELGMKGVSRITVLYPTDAPARLRDGAIRGVRIPAKNFRLFLLQQNPG